LVAPTLTRLVGSSYDRSMSEFATIPEVLEGLRAGRMIVLVDD